MEITDGFPMSYSFFPIKSDPCPNVGHCPHAAGAAISVLVLQGNRNEEYHRYLNGTINAQRGKRPNGAGVFDA